MARYYVSAGMNCYRASQARSKLWSSLTIGNNGPRRAAGCPSTRRTPQVTAHPGLTKALDAAAQMSSPRGCVISLHELWTGLGAVQVDAKNLKSVQLALSEGLERHDGKWSADAKATAERLIAAPDPKAFEAAKAYDLDGGLDRAEATGHGITRPEMGDMLQKCLDDGVGLDASRKGLIKQAVRDGAFARRSTADLALRLATGKMSLCEAGAVFGLQT